LALDREKPTTNQLREVATRRLRRDIGDVREFSRGQRNSTHQA
jgi:hypothetical protein